MNVRQHAKNLAVLGLRGGGQIAAALLEEHLDTAMKRLYIDSGLLVLPVYIDVVAGTKEYAIPDPAITYLAEDRKLVKLSRMTYEDPDAPDTEQILGRSIISRDLYGFEQVISSGSTVTKLKLYYEPSASVPAGLELVQAYSSTKDEYIPYQVESAAREAVTALVKHYLFSETGKPWYDRNEANIRMAEYLNYINDLRFSAETDFTQRDRTASSSVPFII